MSFSHDPRSARAVFEILVRENTDMLLAYLRSTIDDSATVDDIYQETMIISWNRIHDYDKSRPFAPWLRGIARNLVLAHFRSIGNSQVWHNSDFLDTIEARFQDFLSKNGPTFSEQVEDLLNCMKRLSERLRLIVEMLYERGMSHSQIAIALDEQASTIRKRAQRAREQLYECMSMAGEQS